MIGELIVGAGAVTASGYTYARSRRVRLYRELEGRMARISVQHAPDLAAIRSREVPGFADRLAVVPDMLPAAAFAALRGRAALPVASVLRGFFDMGTSWSKGNGTASPTPRSSRYDHRHSPM